MGFVRRGHVPQAHLSAPHLSAVTHPDAANFVMAVATGRKVSGTEFCDGGLNYQDHIMLDYVPCSSLHPPCRNTPVF